MTSRLRDHHLRSRPPCSCLRLAVATNLPREGLSPPIQCPCRAHLHAFGGFRFSRGYRLPSESKAEASIRLNVWPTPSASRILRCSEKSASTYTVSRAYPRPRWLSAHPEPQKVGRHQSTIQSAGLSRCWSTFRPSSRSFLQTFLGYAFSATWPIRLNRYRVAAFCPPSAPMAQI